MDKDEFKQVAKQLSENDIDVLSTPEFKSQRSIGSREGYNLQQWIYEVDAVNEIIARNRVRSYVRRNNPRVKNILEPRIDSVENTEQGTIRQFFPDTFDLSRYQITVVVSV